MEYVGNPFTQRHYRPAKPVTPERRVQQAAMQMLNTIRDEMGRRFYGEDFKYTNLSKAERDMLNTLVVHEIEKAGI